MRPGIAETGHTPASISLPLHRKTVPDSCERHRLAGSRERTLCCILRSGHSDAARGSSRFIAYLYIMWAVIYWRAVISVKRSRLLWQANPKLRDSKAKFVSRQYNNKTQHQRVER